MDQWHETRVEPWTSENVGGDWYTVKYRNNIMDRNRIRRPVWGYIPKIRDSLCGAQLQLNSDNSCRVEFILGEHRMHLHMMTSSYGNIFRVSGPLGGDFTGHWWFPLTKASIAELWCFLWSAPDKTVVWTIETPVICDAIALIMTSLKLFFIISQHGHGARILNAPTKHQAITNHHFDSPVNRVPNKACYRNLFRNTTI